MMHLPSILQNLKDKVSEQTPNIQRKLTDVSEANDADDLANFVLSKFGVNPNDNTNKIKRPISEQVADNEVAVPERAAGGRVVHSNINHTPTEAQAKAGNYAKDHISIHGLDITIENAKGKTRSGVDANGKAWTAVLPAHYGYIKRTMGADKDHLDVFIGPHIKSKLVFVINQINLENKEFDETKSLICFGSLRQAINTYCKAFSDGKGSDRIGSVFGCSIKEFKDWINSGNTKKPYSNGLQKSIQKINVQSKT